MIRKIKILIGILFVIIGGFFYLEYMFNPVMKIDCVLGKETERRNVSCQILEIKDRGSVLSSSEMLWGDSDEDIITTDKFIEVRAILKAKGYSDSAKPILTVTKLIDDKNQEYEIFHHENIDYWVMPSSPHGELDIVIGKENEYNVFFEVPKDIKDFKNLRLMFMDMSKRFTPIP